MPKILVGWASRPLVVLLPPYYLLWMLAALLDSTNDKVR